MEINPTKQEFVAVELFPCVVIGTLLQRPLEPANDEERDFLDRIRAQGSGGPWPRDLRQPQADNRGFQISSLINSMEPLKGVIGQQQEGGNGGGGGDGAGSYFLDMLDGQGAVNDVGGVTFWRIEPRHSEVELKSVNHPQTVTKSHKSAVLVEALKSKSDPCCAVYFKHADDAQSFLKTYNTHIHSFFGEVRMIAVRNWRT